MAEASKLNRRHRRRLRRHRCAHNCTLCIQLHTVLCTRADRACKTTRIVSAFHHCSSQQGSVRLRWLTRHDLPVYQCRLRRRSTGQGAGSTDCCGRCDWSCDNGKRQHPDHRKAPTSDSGMLVCSTVPRRQTIEEGSLTVRFDRRGSRAWAPTS